MINSFECVKNCYAFYDFCLQTDCLDHDDSSTVDDKQTTSDPKLMTLPHNTSPVSIAANVPPSDVLTDAPLSPKSPSVLNKRGSLTTVLNVPILPHLPKYSLIIKKAHSDFLGMRFLRSILSKNSIAFYTRIHA